MKRQLIIRAIQIICLTTAGTSAVESQKLNEILSESLDIYNQCEKIKKQRDAAAEKLDKKIGYVRPRIKWLKQPCFDEKKIRHYTDSITMAKNNIEILETCIGFAKITDPGERAGLEQKYDSERQRLLVEEMDAGKPFRVKIDKLKREYEGKRETFEKFMKSYCLLPAKNYPSVTASSVDADFYRGTTTYKWLDKDNKQLVLAWISIRERPAFESNAEKFDNKFFVTKHLPGSIKLWVGNFHIDFHVAKTEWHGKERIAKLIKDFVDLEGLAEISRDGDSNGSDTLVKDSLACSKRYRIIQKEGRPAVKPLTDERVKVKALIRRLKKPPADSEQLKKDRSEIDYWKKKLETYQDRLETGTITDPNKRAAMLAKLEAEKNKLDAEKREITKPYDDQYNKLIRGLKDKNQLLNDATKGFFLKGRGRFEGISETTTKANFSKAMISCFWKDNDGNTLCQAQLQLRKPPEVPKDAKMLDGAYYISDGGDHNFIWVWANDFLVYFGVNKKEWLEQEKVGEILKSFVNLPCLATAHAG